MADGSDEMGTQTLRNLIAGDVAQDNERAKGFSIGVADRCKADGQRAIMKLYALWRIVWNNLAAGQRALH